MCRYDGKPLLRILECYVLWAIRELGEREDATLRDMEPQLRQALGQQGTWPEVVAGAMALPSNMPELIRENWRKNRDIAEQQGIALAGQQFAEMFVDNNLTNEACGPLPAARDRG